jgi:membrane fusion protein, heavy metal efflux system
VKLKIYLFITCLVLLLNSAYASSTAQTSKQTHNHMNDDSHDATPHDEHAEDEHKGEQNEEAPHAEHEHEEGEHQEETAVHLSASQQALAGIVITALKTQALSQSVYAPGEIKANGYKSYIVSPRVDSVVMVRHVTLGENVTSKQSLVTLFSEEMIDAQSEFQQAWTEWQRVEKLGLSAVGEQRFVAVRTRYFAANRRLKAFGLSADTVSKIAQNKDYPLGEYTLTAQINGVVISDDFNQGQRIEAGQALMLLSDESSLWVEARLPAQNDIHLMAGQEANVFVDGLLAKALITQEAHTIDQHTRTRIIRMNLDNSEHRFHSGMFADVYFDDGHAKPVLVVPEKALMRNAEGQWQIFIEEHDGELKPQTVILGQRFGNWQQISGVNEGQRYVSEGAFFVASELAKGGFDPHNH